MKKILFAFLLCTVLISPRSGSCQEGPNILPLVIKFLWIKSALSLNDSIGAAKYSLEFAEMADTLSISGFQENEIKLYKTLRDTIIASSKKIYRNKDMLIQKKLFENLTNNMIALSKGLKIAGGGFYLERIRRGKAGHKDGIEK